MSDRKSIREADTQPPPPMHDWLEPLVDGAVAATVAKLMDGRPPELVTHRSRELLQAIVRDAVLSVLEQLVADGPPSEAEVLRLQLDEALKCLDKVRAELAGRSERTVLVHRDMFDQVKRERDEARETIERWQMASGLCKPAEEHGGDPGEVDPSDAAGYWNRIEDELEECKTQLKQAECERDQWRAHAEELDRRM